MPTPVPGTPDKSIATLFDLTDRVAVITGGGGLLGLRHCEVLLQAGANVVPVDIRPFDATPGGRDLLDRYPDRVLPLVVDITDPADVSAMLETILARFARVDILINNAANNPKMEAGDSTEFSRLENFSIRQWEADIAVGLTGAFLCSQTVGAEMARRKSGVIVCVASDLGVIAPDQRLYRQPGLPEDRQPVKPVTYSVVKTALVGLTRYLATYWAHAGVRANAISPGGVFNGQPEAFVTRLSELIPLGRMARVDEYQAAILFLCSDASSYMNGANLVIDGGRSCW